MSFLIIDIIIFINFHYITFCNVVFSEFINEFQRNQAKEAEITHGIKQLTEMKTWAAKNHYLVSTKVQPGIYNSPFNRLVQLRI